MRTLLVGTLGSLVALFGFATTANATATIDLLWGGTSASTSSALASSTITLHVVLTAGIEGSQGAGITVDYSDAIGKLTVVGFTTNPNTAVVGTLLPIILGSTVDTGSQVRNINAAAFPPYVGAGLLAGQSYLLGTVSFHKLDPIGTFSVTAVLTATDDVLDLSGNVISGSTSFNAATLTNVPEPGTVSLLALGLGGLAFAARRKN